MVIAMVTANKTTSTVTILRPALNKTVKIVGAGPAGLSAALAARAVGASVDVGDRGRGLVLDRFVRGRDPRRLCQKTAESVG